MLSKNTLVTLQELISARGPCGQEDEVAKVCRSLMEPLVDELWEDAAGNIIGKVNGEDSTAPIIRIMTHMDELSMLVKRVNDDGTLRVEPLGGLYPASIGQGMVEVLGDKQMFSGVLSYGSMHTTKESKGMHSLLPKKYMGEGKSPEWEDVHIITCMSAEALRGGGVQPGTRVVISQSRREIHCIGDCLASYFMDNRAAIVIALEAMRQLYENGIKPKGDVYLVATTSEEIGALGACFAAKELPGDITLAIDVGPVAEEYQTKLSDEPIIVYQDSRVVYDKKISDRLCAISRNLGQQPQTAIFGCYGSDSSIPKMYGHIAQNILVCIPTANTHGYEMIHQNGINKCADLVAAYLKGE